MNAIKLLCYLFLTILSVDSLSYENYKLYKVIPKNEKEVSILEDIRDSGVGSFWVDYFSVGNNVRIMVAPDQQTKFERTLSNAAVDFTLAFNNLQKVIDEQNQQQNQRSENTFHGLSWDVYHNLSDINAWISRLAEVYSDVVTPVVMGASVEGRDIVGMKIDFKPGRPTKYIAVMMGALHAREWITPAVVTWVVKEFLTSTDPHVRAMAEDLEWHIFPVVNPDGYLYTFNSGGDRMWRKNRSTRSFKPCPDIIRDDISNGVALNRNFDFFWMFAGASNDSCTQTYAGPSPGSEPETQSIAHYMSYLNNQGDIIYFFDMHSFTQLVVIPYSHVSGFDIIAADNYGDMYEIAKRGADKIKERHGTTYRVGVSSQILYVMSGTGFDWVKNNTNTKISYLIELRDLGEYGFLLPASQIIPNSQEIMDGLIEMDKTTRILGYYRGAAASVLFSSFLIMSGVLLSLIS